MTPSPGQPPSSSPPLGAKARAYAVHVLTASGVIFVFLAAAEICSAQPDPRWVFLWLALAVLVDAADGPLARWWETKRFAPGVDGRKIDDILDYLTFTFIPLLLVWRMGWLSFSGLTEAVWVLPAMVTSLLGFAATHAKQEEQGFFLGFPSYWNIVAFYIGLWSISFGPWPGAVMVAALTILTVTPVRFIYPNLAPPPWRWPVLIGGGLWLALMLGMLPWYPERVPMWVMGVSLIYPAAYVALSVYLDVAARTRGVNR